MADARYQLTFSTSYPDNDGNTAMHIACMHNDTVSAKVLLAHQPNLFVENNQGKRPIDLAIENLSMNKKRGSPSTKL